MLNVDFRQEPPKAEDFEKLSRKMNINKAVRLLILATFLSVPLILAQYVDVTLIKFLLVMVAVLGSMCGVHAVYDVVISKCLRLPHLNIAGFKFHEKEDLKAVSVNDCDLLKYCKEAPEIKDYVRSVRTSGRDFVLAEVIAMKHIANEVERRNSEQMLDEHLQHGHQEKAKGE